MMYERADSTPATSRSDSLAFPNSIITAVVIPFLLFQFWSFGTVGHVITPAAQLPAPLPSAAYGSILGGDDLLLDGQPMNWLGKRAVETCDEIGLFICPQGHCFQGSNGFIGCCSSTDSCRVRTTCIEYDEVDETDCDVVTGGCVRCENVAAPECVSLTNVLEDQYAMYCDTKRALITTSVKNKITSASMALMPDEEETSTDSKTASSASETDSTEEDADEASSDSLSVGAIVGIAIGSAIATALMFFLLFWFFLRRRIEYRPSWIKKKSTKKDDHQGVAGATPLFADNDYSSANTPHGLGLNEFEGSTPDNKSHAWAPSSMAYHQPKPMAPYTAASPELDGSPRSVNEADADNTSTISALPKGLRPQSGNTVSALGSASISGHTLASPSIRDSTVSRDTREPLTRAQSQELSFPRSLEISKPSIDGIAASALKTPANGDRTGQEVNADSSGTGNATAAMPNSVPDQQQEHKDARYLSAEMAMTGGYWEKKEKDVNEGGDVRARGIDDNQSGTVTENGQAEAK